MSTCIFPGRFQPFHNGQLLVVKGMIKSCTRTVIAVCHGDQGPHLFTTEQIREMITAALMDEDIVDAEIVFVEDCDDGGEWVDRVLEASGWPEDAQIWSGNEQVLQLCADASVSTKEIKHVPGHDSDEIRNKIEEKDMTWREKVPGGVMRVVDDLLEARS